MTNNSTNNYQTINNHLAYNPHSRLLEKQVYRSDNPYANSGNNPYVNKNNFDTKNPYGPPIEKEKHRKYLRFNDLKLLNEQIINLANNMLSEDSPLEVLSQGQKGEIKVLLIDRVAKISFLPALTAFLLTLIIIFTDHILITLATFVLYIYVLGRFFFYPARLFYENIQHKTTKHAEVFFEEMDFWFKLGVVNTIISLIVVSLLTLILSFFEEDFINLLISWSNNIVSSEMKEAFTSYISTVSFSSSLIFVSLLYIATIFIYFKFINSEKRKNEEIRKERLKAIRNETMSRVEQIQVDKNEIDEEE